MNLAIYLADFISCFIIMSEELYVRKEDCASYNILIYTSDKREDQYLPL